jgi:hypothetical protein
LKLWLQQLKIGWRAARSRAGVVGAVALALMLAVGLSSAIFTTGVLRPLLSLAPDSRDRQTVSRVSDSVFEINRVKPTAPVGETVRQRTREARAQQPATARATTHRVNQRSRRQGYQFSVITLLRLLRQGNHLSVAKLLGSEGERGQ